MSNLIYTISPDTLVFGSANDRVGFSLHINANKKSTIPTIYLEVPYGNGANKLINGDITKINIEIPNNRWSAERELIKTDGIVLFTINSTTSLGKNETINIGFINIPINSVQGSATIKLFEDESETPSLSKEIKKVENRTPSVNVFRATLPFIFRKTNTTLYWNVTNGRNIALYRQYVNFIPRSTNAEDIKKQSNTKLIVSGLLENQTYEIKGLEQNAIFYLFADNDMLRSPYASCMVAVQEPLIINYEIKKGQRKKHVYGEPLTLSWNTQFSNPNNTKNQCWIEYKIYNRDGSLKETRKTTNLPSQGTYTFYPTAPTDYSLCIKEPDFNEIVERISITVSPTTPIGAIAMFSGKDIPKGWMLCNGVQVSLATLKRIVNNNQLAEESHRELQKVLGRNCQTPNLTARFIMGSSLRNVNTKGKADTHTHSINPPKKSFNTDTKDNHTHKFPSSWYKRNLTGGGSTGIDTGGGDIKNERTRGGGGHHHSVTLDFNNSTSTPKDVYPPWYTLCYIIKVLF